VVQGSAFVSNPTVNLLAMPIRSLRGAAAALLPTYASRRRLRSLQDLLQDPEAVKQAFNVLREARAELPWIPTARGLRDPARWEWGLSTATRVCHFLLDLIRMAIEEGSGDLGLLLEARTRVDQSRIRLDTVLADADDSRRLINALGSTDPALPADEKVTRLEALAGDQQGVALREVRDAISAFGDLLSAMDDGVLWLRRDPEEPVEVGRALFGRGWQADPHFTEVRAKDRRARTDLRLSRSERTCLNRLLAIEVVRRAFTAEEPVDSTQRLSFVQLTPDAPTPIFSRDPLEHPFAASAESKLTGIRMGHFAGFLKRSWRANDFMWGRLDAAARIVDLLVDTGRATQIGVEDVAGDITEVLLGNGPTLEQRCLVAEALDADPDRLRRLKGQLRKKLEEDLATKEAPFTRIVLTRAAQLEIVRAELPAIAEATRKDAVDGSSTKPIDFGRVDQGTGELPPDGVLQGAIDNVRDGQETLPVRLGRDDPAEETSDLTARMAARAGFVTLAALRTAKLPAAQALNVLRPPLLAVRGVAAKGFPLRIPLVLGFWAAALYIAARLVDTSGSADLDAIVWNEILLALVAVLTVIGVAVLPIVRGLRRRWRPVAFAEFAGALAIIAVGGGAAVGLALAFGPDLTPGKLIIGNGFDSPPDWVLDLAIATALGLSLARTPLLGRFPWFQNLSKGGAVSAALLAAVAVLVSVWTVQDLVNAIEQGPAWRTVVALVALVLPWTVCLEYILLHTVPRDSQPR
jgi:Protein of unknown function (DUF3376)